MKIHSSAWIRELVSRRVPQVLGIYLAVGWGVLEFTDWAVSHFAINFPITDLVAACWLLAFPFVALMAWKLGRPGGSSSRHDRVRPGKKSVAVLPFANLSDSPDYDYLSDGISEEIINDLARVEGLSVVSRTSVFAYKGRSEDVRTIGKHLNVEAVLEGSVQVAGGRLRITTQLVNVADGYHLWSERYDREMEDIFAIEDEIAESVVSALRVLLRDDEQRALTQVHTKNVKAYEYYLRGRQFFHQMRKKSLEYAREMFGRAVDIDPDYALAYVGIANASAFIHTYYPSIAPDLQQAEEASRKALELDPGLAEAHAARGFALFLMKRYDEAESEFNTATRLEPKLFEAWYFHARACFEQGRLVDAARFFEEASRIREDYQASFFAAQSHEALDNEEQAQAAYRLALEVAEKHMELNPDDPRAATMRAVSSFRLGRPEEGLRWARRALEIDPEDAGVRYNVACLFALEGMTEEAIECLERAVEVGLGSRDWIEHDPDLDSLRAHPRFRALLQRLA